MKNKIKLISSLFISFLKIGAFTFGGGYAMIPLIQKEVVENKQWINDKDIIDIIAISESTPGPIAINSATFIGYKICGFWGSLLATLGVILPSFFTITIISFILDKFQNSKIIQYAFSGIRAAVLALIIKALITMYKQCPKHIISYIIIGLSFIIATFFHINVLIIIIICAILGLISHLIILRSNKI